MESSRCPDLSVPDVQPCSDISFCTSERLPFLVQNEHLSQCQKGLYCVSFLEVACILNFARSEMRARTRDDLQGRQVSVIMSIC